MSKKVFRKIEQEGLLSRTQLAVYRALNKHKLTAGELAMELEYTDYDSAMPRNLIAARLTEMREMGVVEPTGVRTCFESGKKCVEWRVTGKLPTAPKPRRQFWIVEAGSSRRLHKSEKAAQRAAERSNGTIIELVERRPTVRTAANSLKKSKKK